MYVLKRLFQSLITLFVITTVVFLLLRLMPTQFFTSLGIRGLLWALLAPAALEILARTGLAKVRDEKGDS